METYKVIADEKELRWFFDHVIMPPKVNEAYSFCMACRHKKLTKEEILAMDFAAKSDEMMDPTTVFSSTTGIWNFNKWKKGLERYECNVNAFTTRGGFPFPSKALVWYCTPNPSDERNAVRELKKYIAVHEEELISSSIKGSQDGITESLWKLCHSLVKFKKLQFGCVGSKYWVDFDLDLSDVGKQNRDTALSDWRQFCTDRLGKGNFVIVQTTGGFHTLVRKEVVHWNPNKFCEDFTASRKGMIDELKYNTNCMLPTPGTYQYDNVVRVVNKEDFE